MTEYQAFHGEHWREKQYPSRTLLRYCFRSRKESLPYVEAVSMSVTLAAE